MPCGIICGRIIPARGNLEHRSLSGAVINYFRQQGAESETESVRNMRIVAAMARLSRVHVVSLQAEGAPPPAPQPAPPPPPPPDYDSAELMRRKEEEELPSYLQAVSSTTPSLHM